MKFGHKISNMPKCANVVILVIATNVLTITLFTAIRYEKSSTNTFTQIQPLPQPNQLSSLLSIQTGRVIQSVKDTAEDFDSSNNNNNLQSKEEDVDFDKRKQIMDNFCQFKKKNPSEPLTNDPTHLFVLQDRGVAWCPVFKAGSSTLFSTLVDLSSRTQVIFLNGEFFLKKEK